jgi:TusA-related sulfurtransferase
MLRTDKTLDIQGVSGTRTGVVVREIVHRMMPGQILRIITHDREAQTRIAALCRELDCALLAGESEGAGSLLLRKGR